MRSDSTYVCRPSGTEMGLVDDYLGLKSEAIECRRSATRTTDLKLMPALRPVLG